MYFILAETASIVRALDLWYLFKSRFSAKLVCATIMSIPNRQFEFAQLLCRFRLLKFAGQLLGNFTYKILKKSPYKCHFQKKRLRQANPENVLRNY